MPPNEILLLRHAEEPADENDPDLTPAGQIRADRLAVFLPATFGEPDVVMAAAANRTSVRCYLTIRPLCLALGRRIYASLRANEAQDLAANLFADEAFAAKTIVICWTHTELPHLARALGVRARDFPDPWDESVFNLIFKLKFNGGGKPAVTRIVQPF